MSDATERLNAALEGRYTIERELGEGGMATVYLADDLKHERKVALKVLKPELAAVVGADRFLAEIKTTASLQHPHILPLFDSGEADSFLFYVMPHIEGESLRERIDRERQLPVDDAVKIATDLAEALDYAHRHKIIHRDIKPANILIHEGRPLIADFGIALAVGVAGGGRLTETGLSVGTPHYMSPEQATGDQAIGVATDIYALGAVLYEMLIGDPPYTGSTAQAILGKIIQGKTASATEERASVPANVDATIRKALEKLPADRFTSAQDFAKALGDAGFRHGEATVGAMTDAGRWNRLTVAFAAAASVLLAGGAGWALKQSPVEATRLNLAVDLPEGQQFMGYGSFDVSHDGSFIVYEGPSEISGETQLWRRHWSDLNASPIPGTRDVGAPAISPDGLEVAYQTRGDPRTIQGVPIVGGGSRTVADSAWCCVTWGDDGMLYFTGVDRALKRVSPSGGGQIEALLPAGGQTWGSVVVANGKRAVQSAHFGEGRFIQGVNLETGDTTFLVWGEHPELTSTGHLLYVTEDRDLMAVRLDVDRLTIEGPAVAVASDLFDSGDGNGHYSVSDDGSMLVYRRTIAEGGDWRLGWLDGTEFDQVDPNWIVDVLPGNGVVLSPTGDQVVLTGRMDEDDASSIFVKRLPTGPSVRINPSGFQAVGRPFWSPDGRRIAFLGVRDDSIAVYQRRSDGSDAAELLYKHDGYFFEEALWSPDESWLVYTANRMANDDGEIGVSPRDVWGIRLGVDSVPRILVGGESDQSHPTISSDGRWLAYSSNESGRSEVFIRPFPNTQDQRIAVSARGGANPRWSPTGLDLYYVAGDAMDHLGLMRSTVDFDAPFAHQEILVAEGERLRVRDVNRVRGYDIHPQSGRVLSVLSTVAAEEQLILVQNLLEGLMERGSN